MVIRTSPFECLSALNRIFFLESAERGNHGLPKRAGHGLSYKGCVGLDERIAHGSNDSAEYDVGVDALRHREVLRVNTGGCEPGIRQLLADERGEERGAAAGEEDRAS